MVTYFYTDEKVVFRALAHPIRRDIIKRLQRRPTIVKNLAKEYPISRPAISRHLKILEHAGLVRKSKGTRQHVYALHRPHLFHFYKLVKEMVQQKRTP